MAAKARSRHEHSGLLGRDVARICSRDALDQIRSVKGYSLKEYSDMRTLFESKDVDAVSLPLPNHWHALATIWACQAGKDVYVEKPACHNIFEVTRW